MDILAPGLFAHRAVPPMFQIQVSCLVRSGIGVPNANERHSSRLHTKANTENVFATCENNTFMVDPLKVLTAKAAHMVLKGFDCNLLHLFVQQVSQLLSTVANVQIVSFPIISPCISVYPKPFGRQTANKPEIFLRSQAHTSRMK